MPPAHAPRHAAAEVLIADDGWLAASVVGQHRRMGSREGHPRLAVPADAAAVVRLVRSAYRGDESREGWTSEADLVEGGRIDADGVLALIAGSSSMLIVLDDPAGLLGCCQLEDRGDGLAYLGMLAVRPRQQGGGVGRRLVSDAERRAVDTFGATAMEMTVVKQQVALLAWYERLGFARTGETRPFPYDDPDHAVPLRDDLEFVVLRKEGLASG